MPVVKVRIRNNLPKYLVFLVPVWFFFAFFTGIKLLPQLANNVGMFEIFGILITLVYLGREGTRATYDRHPLVLTVWIMTATAVISQLQMAPGLRGQGWVQVAILGFLLTFLVVSNSFINKYRISPSWFLQIVVVCAFVAGILVVWSGLGSQDINVAGAFRNRAHMASYMLTTFWLCLIAVFWPGLPKWSRFASLGAVMLALYAVAISGRRSVYISLFVGMMGLVASLLIAQRGKRTQWILAIGVALAFVVGLYTLGGRLNSQTAFFQTRVGLVDDRLRSFLGNEESQTTEKSFFALQREGVKHAFSTSPILGIGWGGFPKSQYSPTGHEVHSTPLRFVAELGALGLLQYLVFMAYLLGRSASLFLRMRASPYGNSYLVLALAIWSLSISYVYNRHMTERTFWILLAIFLSMEVFASDWHALKARFSPGSSHTSGRPQSAPRLRGESAAAPSTISPFA